jgi:hypothetical protein
MRKTCIALLGLAAALSLVSSPRILAQDGDCTASAEATLDTDEEGNIQMLSFHVEVSTSENCAKIEYDLVLDELMPDGQTKKERLPRQVDHSDGSYEEIVQHKIPASFQLSSYQAKIVSCQRCSIMP